MTEIDFTASDLNTPTGRQAALKQIQPNRETARKYHVELLDLFRREMKFRRETGTATNAQPCAEDETEYFEHLYWCAFLLYLVGDPADVPLMWEAKHVNMDAGCGFDVESLVGAGVQATIKYLNENGRAEIAQYIKGISESDLPAWELWRRKYFYGS
jgi:hypothetical protein